MEKRVYMSGLKEGFGGNGLKWVNSTNKKARMRKRIKDGGGEKGECLCFENQEMSFHKKGAG